MKSFNDVPLALIANAAICYVFQWMWYAVDFHFHVKMSVLLVAVDVDVVDRHVPKSLVHSRSMDRD